MYKLMLGDCLQRMKEIPDGSVDAIITDPPYGTVKNIGDAESIAHGMKGNTEWDVSIETGLLYEECNRILRTNGALVIFSQEPYTNHLIHKAHNNIPFSYRMTWLKDHFANSLIAKKAPVNYTEDINVFFKKYDTLAQHPLREYAKKVNKYTNYNRKRFYDEFKSGCLQHFLESGKNSSQFCLCTEDAYSQLCEMYGIDKQEWFIPYTELKEINRRFERVFNLPEGKKFKSNVLEYMKDYSGHHPTQKPIALMEDLIKTYTNEGNTVLDFTMGSGSTGVAAVNTNRNFIGIELDEGYFEIAKQRIEQAEIEKKRQMNYNCV